MGLIHGIESQPAAFDTKAFDDEARAIADWWIEYAIDDERGGFWGQVGVDNVPVKDAPKCIIQNARILWFFAEAARQLGSRSYRDAADRAFDYLLKKFWDNENGGFYWMLAADGSALDQRKHTYAQAFAIYGLCAYFELSRNATAFDHAKRCFSLIEAHARDAVYNGYYEARSAEWHVIDNIRLSEKEDDSPKTMNTHLHVLEAYTALNTVAQKHLGVDEEVRTALHNLLKVVCEHIVDERSGHLRMFMTNDWQDRSKAYSFGHDIEASWLIHEAVQSLEDSGLAAEAFQVPADRMAAVCFAEGMREDGAMADEFHWRDQSFATPAWWVQAEAMLGFAYLQSIGRGEAYVQASADLWQHIQLHYKDQQHGEWFWFPRHCSDPAHRVYKSGAWKGPYHNGRAALMMRKLLSQNCGENSARPVEVRLVERKQR